MIDDRKAIETGVKFLLDHTHTRLAKYVDEGKYCLDGVFNRLLKRWGKRYVLYLYQELSGPLKEYVMCTLSSESKWLKTTLHNIDKEFDRAPTHIENFTNEQFRKFKRRCNKVILQYLRGGKSCKTKS